MRLPSPRLGLVAGLVAVLLAVTGGALSTLAGPRASAGAATSQVHGYLLKAGPALGRGNEWMGSYTIDGHPPGYCIDYGKTTPHAVRWNDVRSAPNWSTERFQRISYVLNRYGTTSSNTQAAAVNAAVNLLIGNQRFATDWRSSYVPQLARRDTRVAPLASRMIAESATLRGPYRVTVQVTRTALVGGSARARITVTSAAGKGLAGVPLSVALGNALPARALPRATGSNGSAIVDLVPSAPGRVTVRAAASGLIQSSLIRLSSATGPSVQRLAAAVGPRLGAVGAAGFRSGYPAATLKAAMACTGDCAGAPPITVSATNSSTRDQLQVFVLVDGKVVTGKVLTLAAGRSGSMRLVVHDGNRVSLAYRWQQGRRWTSLIGYGMPIVVDCPPAAHVDFTVDCPCDGEIVATVRDVNATRYQHVISVQVAGRPTVSVTVQPRTTGALSGVRWARGTVATVWNQNLLNGRNVGPAVKVTTIDFG